MIWFLAFIIVAAIGKAVVNYTRITSGFGVTHAIEWTIAGACTLTFAWCVCRFAHYPLWVMVPMCLGGAGLFAIIHRWVLNKWRGKQWWYLSPSSMYDKVVFDLYTADPNASWKEPRDVAFAGGATYVVEAIVTVIATVIIVLV